ncbi:MAG TPA: Mur ligase family protein [Solirubrobacterales bacterium]|nr:Mur ligase family protein [Solirubrobacterales bacterium]
MSSRSAPSTKPGTSTRLPPSARSPFCAEAGPRPERPPLPAGPYLVVGLGRAGQAAAAALAAEAGAGSVRVWDGAADSRQRKRAAELRAAGVEVWLGGDGLDLPAGIRTIVKSPGVRPDIPLIAASLERGIPVIDELELGWHVVPAPTVAVTGSNGKSTVAGLCLQLLAAHGLDPVLTGNTEYGPPLSQVALGETPDSVVAEVSSFQAESARDLAVDAAIFTNLTPDHLNRHGGLNPYREAKRRLFVRGEWCVPFASVNQDDELGRQLVREVRERGGTVCTYGFGGGADYRIARCSSSLEGAELELETPDGPLRLQTRLTGRHNAANVTAVLAFAEHFGLPREITIEALSTATPVSGRFERVPVDRPFDVFVDFGYTPGSVQATLSTARELAAARGGRLLVVLGQMGRAGAVVGHEVGACARERSDHLILAPSSYVGEPRIKNLAAAAAGAREARGGTLEVVIDWRRAIAAALDRARPGDIVVLQGRGATRREATDRRGGYIELDDREIVRELA